MILTVRRAEAGRIATLGILFVDGEFFCYTLEDPVRHDGVKVPGQTAIPYGEYQVEVTWSAKFKRDLPLLIDVPGFTGVRIHPGNDTDDTAGCLLVGEELVEDRLINSRKVFDPLFERIKSAREAGEAVMIQFQAVA